MLRKLLVLCVVVMASFIFMGTDGCDSQTSADKEQAEKTEIAMNEAQRQVGMPNIVDMWKNWANAEKGSTTAKYHDARLKQAEQQMTYLKELVEVTKSKEGGQIVTVPIPQQHNVSPIPATPDERKTMTDPFQVPAFMR